MVRKKRIEKVLLAPDGAQACAQLGMVDGDGALFYVADVGTKRLEHVPMSYLMADVEADLRREREEHEVTRYALSRTARALESAVLDIEFLLGDGKFTRGVKSDYRQRLTRLRKKLEEVEP